MKGKKLGIRAKFSLELGAIIAVCLVCILVANSQLLERVYIWNVEHSLKAMAQQVEEQSNNYFILLNNFEREKNVSIDLYDSQDNYLYEGNKYFISSGKLSVISRKENIDGSYFNIVESDDSTNQYILFGKDFKNGNHIEIFTEKDTIQENASLAVKVTTTITILALGLTLIYIFNYAKRFTKPLIQMNEVMENIANLDFSSKTNIERNDEIGTLAKNINKVSASLDNALTELKDKNIELQKDIERERKLEKMRQDFVSSASHELKTPIAIIRGYAEGLKMASDDSESSVGEYCDIIMNEADKMNDLVINMLEQSLYTSGSKEPDKSIFSVDEFIKDFIKSVSPISEEKGITVKYEGYNFLAFADKKQMTTVLSNITLNAFSHTQGEKEVDIYTEDLGDFIKVNVYNTGSFVAEKDKEGIFTSFYRADKAHSRKEGRFGLGLAIVKSITDNHGCTCGFENKENGVVFYFTMEKAHN